jgi:hypothetical protein
MQCYGTVQTTDFSLATWYRPQAVLEGCRVSWLEAVAEWRSFRVARYLPNKTLPFLEYWYYTGGGPV